MPISPLREALQVLRAEGLVRIPPRIGIHIAEPDLALVRDAFQLREFLEVPAVRHAAGAMPRESLEAMRSGHLAMLARTPGLEVTPALVGEVEALDRGMHFASSGSLSNAMLTRTHRHTFDRIRPVRLDQLYRLAAATIERALREPVTARS